MQVIDDSWTLRAQEIAEKRKEITPPRGVLFDRNGKKIVANRTYYNLMVVEANMKNFDTSEFAELIGWTNQQVRERFEAIREGEGKYYNKHTGKTTSNYQKIRAYPFIKEMTLEEVARIAPHLENFPGFYEEVTSMRSYPFAKGANIVGYLSEVNREEVEEDRFYKPGNNIGRAGIERFYEQELRGRKGIKYIVTSALNNAIESYAGGKYDTTAKQGPQLTLGVDIILQAYGEKLLKGKRGCIVAIEPSTGEILSLVSAPSYDPNLLIGKRNISTNYSQLLLDPSKPLYPRPLAAEYPPGSTFKLASLMAALEDEKINIDDTVNAVGVYQFNGRTLHDSHKGGYGKITIRKAFIKSSNVISKIIYKAYSTEPQAYIDRLESFGLTEKLNLDVTHPNLNQTKTGGSLA
jgi:penicillin-binding protein 2